MSIESATPPEDSLLESVTRDEIHQETSNLLDSLAAAIPPDPTEQAKTLIRESVTSKDPKDRIRVAQGWWYMFMHESSSDRALFSNLARDKDPKVRVALATNEAVAWANPEILTPLAEDSSPEVRASLATNPLFLMRNATMAKVLVNDPNQSVRASIDPVVKRYLWGKISVDQLDV